MYLANNTERQYTLHASRGGSSDHKCMQQIYNDSTREPLIISKPTQWEALQIELINYFSAKSSSLPPTLRLTALHFYILVLPGINPWQCWPFMYKPIEKEAQYRGRGHILCMIFSSQRAGWISRCDSIKQSAIKFFFCQMLSCDWVDPPKHDVELEIMAKTCPIRPERIVTIFEKRDHS